MMRSILFSLALSATLVPLADAQTATSLRAGDRVRVRAETVSGQFSVLDARGDSLTLQDAGGGAPVHVRIASIDRLDLSLGQRDRWSGAARRGALGLAIGVVGGGLLGLSSGDDPPEMFISLSAQEKAVLGGVVLGAAGGVTGAIIGAISPGQRWQRIGEPTAISVAPSTGGGVSIGLSRRF